MTISSTGTRYSYSGNGATTAFSFPRQFFASTDLKVYLVDDATGAATLQVLATHYTVTGAGSASGGTVTMLTAPATGKTLVIYRDTPFTQPLDLDNVSSFPMTSIEAAFDRAMMAIDELATKVGRAVLGPLTRVASFDYTLPAPVASKILGINADATAFELREPQSWTSGAGDPASGYGAVGDYYFNTASGDVFKKIGASTWSLIGNMVGPQGPQGIQGIQGIPGQDGTSVTILGTVANTGLLPTSGNTIGDGYLISGDLYVWDGSAWNNVGNIQGPQGVQGPQGEQGPQGDPGATGAAGADGSKIYSGSGAPLSGTGVTGDWYFDYTAGNIYEKTAPAVWTLRRNLIGPQGAQGPQGDQGDPGANGSVWYSGSGAPSSGLGFDGDFYLRTDTDDVYAKAAGAWSVAANLRGDTGPQGPTGSTGPQGAQGDPGADGLDVGVSLSFSTTTSDADPGSGIIRFNNGSIGSVTQLYIDNLDGGGASISALIDTFDDSTTSSNRGTIYFRNANNGGAITFKVTGSVVDGTGYRKVPVSYLSGALPSNNDVLLMTFARSGDVGAAGSGSGDMVKTTYDTDDDGVVDQAEYALTAPWSGISGKPTTLSGYGITDAASSTHNHTSASITDFQEAAQDSAAAMFAAGTHTRISFSYDDASGAFNATVPVAAWADISGKPTTIGDYGITDAYTDTEVDTLLGGYQPLDGDLSAIAALAGTIGFLKKTAANTWALDTSTYLTSLGIGSLTQAWDADLDAIAALGGTSGILTKTAANTWALDTTAYAPLASPTFTGTPAAPTASAWTDSTQIATTAQVAATVKTVPANSQTGTSYTLALTDAGKAVRLNNASAITLTIPTNATVAFPVDTRIDIIQMGAGQVTVGGAGVTIRSSGSKLKLTGQYSGATLLKIATDEWVLIGDITT